MPSVSVDLTGLLSGLDPLWALGGLAAFLVAKMAWDAWLAGRRPKLTLKDEYELYERALRDAKTDEERAELEGVRRSIIRRMAGWRPPFLLYAIVTNCPVSIGCALWLAATAAFGGDLLNVAAWTMLLVGAEIVVNVLGIFVSRGPRPPRGRHFRR